jgi:segregation and condensation protein A
MSAADRLPARPAGWREVPGELPSLRPPRHGPTALRIAPDTHPDRAAHVSLGEFDGPLALLLGLIEQRRLDILDVRLGDLAGAYLEALAELESEHLPHISSFIAVAAQLILIKSRAILPRPPLVAIPVEEGHDPEAELRERLIIYRRFRDAGTWLAGRLAGDGRLHHRQEAAAAASARSGARPQRRPALDPGCLAAALESCFRLAPPPAPPPQVMPRIVTLEERAAIIRAALRQAPAVVLQDILRDVHDRVVVAVTFLAMLELVKGHELAIEQDEPFGPIRCRALTTPAASGAEGATPPSLVGSGSTR